MCQFDGLLRLKTSLKEACVSEKQEKFTPGPWATMGSGQFGPWAVYKASDVSVLAEPKPLCVLDNKNGYEELIECPEQDANASLISCAPEMYDLLCDLHDMVQDCTTQISSRHWDAVHKIDNLLTKARGESLKPKLDYSKIANVSVSGIDLNDAPKFVDAYIESATHDGKPMAEAELEVLNADRDYVRAQVDKRLY
jgi:hypothetical protein